MYSYEDLLNINRSNPYYDPGAATSGTYLAPVSRLSQTDLLNKLAGLELGQGIPMLDKSLISTDQNNQWNNYGYYYLDPTGMLQRYDMGTLTADKGNVQPLTGYLTTPTGEKISPTLISQAYPEREVMANRGTLEFLDGALESQFGIPNAWQGGLLRTNYGLNYGGNTYDAGTLDYDISDNTFMGLKGNQWAGLGTGLAMVGGAALGGYYLAPAVAAGEAGATTGADAWIAANQGLLPRLAVDSSLALGGTAAGAEAGAGLTAGTGLLAQGAGLAPSLTGAEMWMAANPGLLSEAIGAQPFLPIESFADGVGGDVDAGYNAYGNTPGNEQPWTGTYKTDSGSSLFSKLNTARRLYNTGKTLLGGQQPGVGAGASALGSSYAPTAYTPTNLATSLLSTPKASTSPVSSIGMSAASGSNTSENKNMGGASQSKDYMSQLAKLEAILNGNLNVNNKLPWEMYG